MPCDTIYDDQGRPIGIVCHRSPPNGRCKCGNDSTSLCDYPLSAGRSGKTCDAKLCRSCARRLGTEELEKLRAAGIAITSPSNVDLCPAHARLVGLS